MALLGVGLEILQLDDLPDPDRDPSYYQDRLFPEELDYCLGMATPKRHLAGRLAAKRAAAKSLGLPPEKAGGFKTQRNERGAVTLLPPASHRRIRFFLSITHEGPLATAVVVAESDEKG